MPVLGVSVYPDIRPMAEIKEYLALAARYGFTRVFSSMFSVDGAPEEVLGLFGELNDVAHRYGMEVALDVEPRCMSRMGATPADLGVFAKIRTDIIRMDGAYGEEDNLCMLQNPYGIKIEYNASALMPQQIESLVTKGADRQRLLACHNFYPQRYTGFSWEKYRMVNDRLRNCGIRVGAFMASQAPGTHGAWDAACGLPTVERIRDYPADLQARILVAGGATEVLFGNAYASEAELAAVQQALSRVEPEYLSDAHKYSVEHIDAYLGHALDLTAQKKVKVEPVYNLSKVEKTILFDYFPHLDMGDSSEWIWRSRGARQFFQDQRIEPRRYAADYFMPGDVVMVNANYQHYAGEVQVVIEPIKNDGTRNLVARINEEEFTMFDVIYDHDIVVFVEE